MNNNDRVERLIVAMTALALNAPSTYTIAWSKDEHKKDLPILYAGIGTSALTVLGAILGNKYFGEQIMWGGLIATLGLFGYTVFMYKPNGADSNTIILGKAHNGEVCATHLLVG